MLDEPKGFDPSRNATLKTKNNWPNANFRSAIMLCVVAERDHRIGAGGPKCGDVTGEQCNRRQCNSDENESRGIKCANVVKQHRQRPCGKESEDQSNRAADSNEFCGVTNH